MGHVTRVSGPRVRALPSTLRPARSCGIAAPVSHSVTPSPSKTRPLALAGFSRCSGRPAPASPRPKVGGVVRTGSNGSLEGPAFADAQSRPSALRDWDGRRRRRMGARMRLEGGEPEAVFGQGPLPPSDAASGKTCGKSARRDRPDAMRLSGDLSRRSDRAPFPRPNSCQKEPRGYRSTDGRRRPKRQPRRGDACQVFGHVILS